PAASRVVGYPAGFPPPAEFSVLVPRYARTAGPLEGRRSPRGVPSSSRVFGPCSALRADYRTENRSKVVGHELHLALFFRSFLRTAARSLATLVTFDLGYFCLMSCR